MKTFAICPVRSWKVVQRNASALSILCTPWMRPRESRFFINIRWPPRDLTALRSDIFTVFYSFCSPQSQELFYARRVNPNFREARSCLEWRSHPLQFSKTTKTQHRKHFTTFCTLLEILCFACTHYTAQVSWLRIEFCYFVKKNRAILMLPNRVDFF